MAAASSKPWVMSTSWRRIASGSLAATSSMSMPPLVENMTRGQPAAVSVNTAP
jgi:hypothetical protein